VDAEDMIQLATTGDYIDVEKDKTSNGTFIKKFSDKVAELICSEKHRVCS